MPAGENPASGVGVNPAAKVGGLPDLIYLKAANGELVPVLKGPIWEEYLEFIKKRRTAAAVLPDPYSVTNVSLDGDCDRERAAPAVSGERATLTAKIEIQINRADEWVRVPLRMGEGTLRSFSHEGPPQQTGEAVFDRLDPEQGHLWWLSGKGIHNLTLVLSVPVRKESPQRRLQLSLPVSAASDLKLRVPQPRISARAEERKPTVIPQGDSGSEISLIGLGTRLDLTWLPQPELAGIETVLEARTSIGVSLDGESILIEANQRILALQGRFEEVKVWLPAGHELLKVEGSVYKEHRVDPENPNRITVALKEPVAAGADAINLKWTLRADLPAMGERISLEGFEVDRARVQTGILAVRLVGAYQVAKTDDDDRFVQRTNVSEVAKAVPPVPSQGEITSAYRLLKQPFRLGLSLQKVQPFVTVEPYLFVNLAADRAEFEGVFQFHVFRGGVDEVVFDWPNWKREGWKIELVEPLDRVEQTILDDTPGKESIRVRLIERKEGLFDLRLKAQRMLPGNSTPVDFSLPASNASSSPPAVVVVALADNVEADLKPTGETSARPLAAALSETAPLPKWARDARRKAFWVDSRARTFSAVVTPQKQQIETQADIEARIDDAQVEVVQRIGYDVAYGRLAQVLLKVPLPLVDRCTFSCGGIELIPTANGLTEGAAKQLRLTLDPPQIGRFEILVRYAVQPPAHPADTTATLSLPLVQSADAEFAASRFRLVNPTIWTISLPEETWKRQPGTQGTSAWSAVGALPELILTFDRGEAPSPTGMSISRALIRAEFDLQGRASYRAQFRISGPASGLRLQLGPGIRPTFWFGRERLAASEVAELQPAAGEFQLNFPPHDLEAEHLLSIDYQTPAGTPFAATERHRLVAPRLTAEAGATQTIWEVVMPSEQHLFTAPAGVMPLFTWRRGAFFWGRYDSQSTSELERWIAAGEGPPRFTLDAGGNCYRFTGFGLASVLDFRTMSRHIIVLIGAGLALLVGFMLMNIPATRHVLTILLLGFASTVLALWFPEPVLVLLQPAGLGLLLAIVAASIQGALRRTRKTQVLTLSSPSGFASPASSIRREAPLGLGSDEPTSIRPAPSHSS
jgi:hypothetical protein